MKTYVLIALILSTTLLGGAWWYFGADRTESTQNAQTAAVAESASTTETVDVPAPIEERVVSEAIAGDALREYKNEKYRFSLLYPQSLGVKEYKEAEGAMSVTFESTIDDKSFQIYVTPYKEKQITKERFLLDVPSGVRREEVEVVVDGARGSIFFSEHSLMGETREVWFIKNGYLYEVVTYKELDLWLADVMKSWRFI